MYKKHKRLIFTNEFLIGGFSLEPPGIGADHAYENVQTKSENSINLFKCSLKATC